MELLIPAFLASAALAAPGQPVFRSGTELIRLDVTVVDGSGRPVRDLGPSDFLVQVDGQPRGVRFAEFSGPDENKPSSRDVDALGGVVSNVDGYSGRVVLIVIDRESVRPMHGRPVLEAAAQILGSLSPRDAIGFVPIPGAMIGPTRDHRPVAEALRNVTTTRPPRPGPFGITLEEASDLQRGQDKTRIERIQERVCAYSDRFCRQQLKMQAFEMLTEARHHARHVAKTLTEISRALAAIEGPKQIVFLSSGLAFDLEVVSWFRDLSRAAAESGVTVYTIHLDRPSLDASTEYSFGPLARDRAAEDGLRTVAEQTGGAFFSAVGSGRGVLERVRTQIDSQYYLGVESRPSDRDGRRHDVDVRVKRSGVTVSARRQVVLSRPPSGSLTPLQQVLQHPVDVTDLPVALGAFVAQGDDPETVKVILLGELVPSSSGQPPINYGFFVGRDDKATHEIAERFETHPARAVTAVQVAPGVYSVRFGAVTSDGRRGSVEARVDARLHAAGDLQASDVLVGTLDTRFEPVLQVAPGTLLTCLLEVYGSAYHLFEQTTVTLELLEPSMTDPIATAPAPLQTSSRRGKQVAEGEITVPEGVSRDYVVQAVVRTSGTTVATITRKIRVAKETFSP